MKPVSLIIGADAAKKLVEQSHRIAVMSSSDKGEALGTSLGA